MNLQKIEAKLGAVNEIGCRLDDNLEGAQRDFYRTEGASIALKQAITSYETLVLSLDKELNENENIDLDSVKLTKKYLEKGRALLVGLQSAAENNKIIQSGKVQGFELAVSVAKKYRDEEVMKIQKIKDSIESGEIEKIGESLVQKDELIEEKATRRPTGVRPARTLKEIRRSEENNLKNSDNTSKPKIKK